MSVKIVTNKNIDNFLREKTCSAIYFWANWDAGTNYVAERFCYVSQLFPAVNFGMMDVDQEYNWTLVSLFGIVTLPTILYFAFGKDEIRIKDTGFVTTNRMVQRLRLLSKSPKRRVENVQF